MDIHKDRAVDPVSLLLDDIELFAFLKEEILTTHKKHHFAKPYPELLDISKKINATGIEFDMVYAPKTWLAYFENEKLFEGKTVIYVHTGGVIGNVTQCLRYEHKKIL